MKNLLPNKEFQLDEILFENRNKNYGAYVLRNEADRILTKSMLIGIGVFAMIAITPLIMNVFNEPKKTNVSESFPPIDMQIVDQPEKPPVAVQAVPPVSSQVNTLNSTVPTPTKEPKIEKVMPKHSDYDQAVAGTEEVIGTPPVINYTPSAVQNIEVKSPEITIPKPVDNSPRTTVDIQADFTGGINAFRNKVVNQFDTSVLDGRGEVVKTTLVFIIEKDGSISEVKATGPDATFNREAIKTIKAVKGKWIPAKVNGENVRSYFNFPISMKFE